MKRTSWFSCLMAGNGAELDFLCGILEFGTEFCMDEGTVLEQISIKILRK